MFAFLSLVITVLSLVLIDPKAHVQFKLNHFAENLKVTFNAVKEHKAVPVLVSICIFSLAPSYHNAYNYYLTNVLGFSSSFLSFQQIAGHVGHLLGIVSISAFISIFTRSRFLKIVAVGFVVCTAALIPIIKLLETDFANYRVATILTHTAVCLFMFEMITLTIQTILIEICPIGKETFFMSVIFFMRYVCRSLSMMVGSLIIFLFVITKDDMSNFWYTVLAFAAVSAVAVFLLLVSDIPSPKIGFRKKLSEKGEGEGVNPLLLKMNCLEGPTDQESDDREDETVPLNLKR